LLLRGSFDFDSVDSYQQLLEQVVVSLNRRCADLFSQEREHLQPLPEYPFADYEILSVRVTCHSTITVRCILYTVPSQLIGHRLSIHLYHDRLLGFLGNQLVVELPRIYSPANSERRRARCINYRHIIDSLRRKPRAFLQYQWKQDLLPNDDYRRIWEHLDQQFSSEIATRLIVESLYIAAKQDKEYAVAQYLMTQLEAGSLTLVGLQKQFHLTNSVSMPAILIQQHQLSDYDQLLNYASHRHHSHRNSQSFIEVPQTASYEPLLARIGTNGAATGMDSCSVSACLM
jgi:hypothetical protein